jgi:nitroreductase
MEAVLHRIARYPRGTAWATKRVVGTFTRRGDLEIPPSLDRSNIANRRSETSRIRITKGALLPLKCAIISGAFRNDKMDALTVLTTRSVVRRYTAAPIPDPLSEQLLEVMFAAPKAFNTVAWEVVVVRQSRLIRRIRAFAPGIIGMPTLIVVVCLDHRQTDGLTQNAEESLRLCAAMAIENLLLAAHANGLGACPAGSFRPAETARLIGLPDHLEVLLLVSVGYPSTDSTRPNRPITREVISYERWGEHRSV